MTIKSTFQDVCLRLGRRRALRGAIEHDHVCALLGHCAADSVAGARGAARHGDDAAGEVRELGNVRGVVLARNLARLVVRGRGAHLVLSLWPRLFKTVFKFP